ncbi:D-amino-acid transaminase [Nitratifractor sp.]
MESIVYLNGDFLPKSEAKISAFDRGFLLADGVYEVVPVIRGRMIDRLPFRERFTNSLRALKMEWPMPREAFEEMMEELIRRNGIEEGGIYVQVTRGVAPARTFEFPKGLEPTVMAFAFAKEILHNTHAEEGVPVVTVEDIRWKRRDIKSIALLGQCMAKEEAVEKGAYEGWMVEDGFVTEGVASSAYIVKDGTVITRPLSNRILPGIRRKVLLELAPAHGLKVEERPFTVEEAYEADEAFLSSATTLIYPIVRIDDRIIGDGRPGPVTKKLRELYVQSALAEATGELREK